MIVIIYASDRIGRFLHLGGGRYQEIETFLLIPAYENSNYRMY